MIRLINLRIYCSFILFQLTNRLFDHFLSALFLGNLVDIVRAVVSTTVEHGIFILYICGFDEDKEWSFEVRHNRDTTL